MESRFLFPNKFARDRVDFGQILTVTVRLDVFRCCCWGANRIFGSCILYKDSEFPADASSLGEYEAKGQAVFWVRGNDILAPLEDVNGDGKIEANERKHFFVSFQSHSSLSIFFISSHQFQGR